MRTRRPPDRYGASIADISECCVELVIQIAAVGRKPNPKNVRDALSGDEAEQWCKAMDQEYASLIGKETWELSALPLGRTAISCKWILVLKYHADGTLERHKARLVARGFSQRPGEDYDETYSPVAGLTTIRTLIAAAVEKGWRLDQYDVTTAYLNGILKEDIYMEQPEGYKQPGKEHLVCHLRKSLYGLKQAGRAWNDKLDETLLAKGFRRCPSDACVYHIEFPAGRAVLTVYVDDLVAMSSNDSARVAVRGLLNSMFEIKDLGPLHYILGIEFVQGDACLRIHQTAFIEKTVQKFGLTDAKSVTTPIEPGARFTKDQCPSTEEEIKEMQNVPYRSLIGALLYIAGGSRPDIGFAVSMLAQFSASPARVHWEAAKRVLRYLKGTADHCLLYTCTGKQLAAASDADWASNQSDRRSFSGCVVTLAGGPIAWYCRKQTAIVLSTTESEYVALADCTREIIWIRRLLREVQMGDLVGCATNIYCDSQSAIALCNSRIERGRSKHIDVKHHFLREHVANDEIALVYVPTDRNLADILTKGLPKKQHQYLRGKLISPRPD